MDGIIEHTQADRKSHPGQIRTRYHQQTKVLNESYLLLLSQLAGGGHEPTASFEASRLARWYLLDLLAQTATSLLTAPRVLARKAVCTPHAHPRPLLLLVLVLALTLF